jgi:deoxyribodipyrimidine photo-lyase
MNNILWWIRRDFRLTDNEALFQATQQAEFVTPIFILDPFLIHSSYVGEKRLAFLYAGLHQLNVDLLEVGSHLVIREGQPSEVFAEIQSQMRFDAIYAEADFSPYAQVRDSKLNEQFPIKFFGGPSFRHPLAVRKANGEPYTTYTPYSRAWKSLPNPSEKHLRGQPHKITSAPDLASIPLHSSSASLQQPLFVPGEREAQRQLKVFIENDPAPIYGYGSLRDRMDLTATSQLSPYLRFGMLSARNAIVAATAAISRAQTEEEQQSATTWLNELIWRDFYHSILFNFPHVRQISFRENLRGIEWENNPDEFKAWCYAETGYPIIDAAMRQLIETGWMHNRARMIVASFLVKDLLIDWRWGEKWFMQHLIDGDPAANNGGWQWSAGTGTDAAPYFRIFNPILQAQKFDPMGNYVKQWVPELSGVPIQYLHKPWEMPLDLQKSRGVVIGKDYPKRIIEHSYARERSLERFRSAKNKVRENKKR